MILVGLNLVAPCVGPTGESFTVNRDVTGAK
jgi:hypothetical protein